MGGGHAALLLLSSFYHLLLPSHAALYNSSDAVIDLDHESFYSTIIGAENAWVVEFYNTWCGHCIAFAPTWKKFALDTKDWAHTVKVAAIDCSVPEAVPICREYDVMGYPTIKLFAAKVAKGDEGTVVHSRSVEEMKKSTVDFIIEKQKAKNGSASWVNLQPYQGGVEGVWGSVGGEVEHVAVLVDHPGSYVAPQAALDLAGHAKFAVLVSHNEGGLVKNFRTGSNPSLVYVERHGGSEVVENAATTREDLVALVVKRFGLKKRDGGARSLDEEKKPEIEGAGDGRPEEIHSDKLNYEDDLPDTGFTDTERKDQVYMVDIENAVSYAIKHEAAQKKVIKGEALRALQEFLDVMVLYLPARPAVHEFLERLHKFTTSHGESITGEQLEKAISSLQDQQSVLPEQQPWMGCRGSQPKFRGYPCGLWTTFHTLTVNSAILESEKMIHGPKKTLRAIHGYVKHFFSCSYCSKHFDQMYLVDAEESVNVADDAIIWLWRGHNKVNKRLHGDASEDPEHVKVQFPTKAACPACYDGENMNEKEILAYLKDIYFKRSLSFKGTQTIVAPAMNRQARVKALIDQYQAEDKGSSRRHGDVDSLRPLNTWGFNNTDISLCVILYVISTIIIMGVYCLVVIRRKMRKRKFLELYKQPVATM